MTEADETGTGGLGAVVERLDALTRCEVVSVEQIAQAFGKSSFVALMLVPAILVISPLSGVPFLSSVCGLSIALVAAQMLARREHLWLPQRLLRARLEGARVHRAAERFQAVARWLDRHSKDRLTILTRGPLSVLPQALCVLAGLAMPFLELVPFSSSILGTAVVMFGAGFLTRDGAFTVAGVALMGLASMVPLGVLSVVAGG